jgi:imidazoleglycerol-phosphate dehydratase/histidinol-phosphatase
MAQKVLFIDRDGTLIEEPLDNQVDSLDKVKLIPGVFAALSSLADKGFRFVMVTNQDGLGSASFPEDDFRVCQDHIISLFESQGIVFDEVLICPHREEDFCDCRKPLTGLFTKYLAKTDIDMKHSAVIGDRATDMMLADNLGLKGFMISPEWDWSAICSTLTGRARRGSADRITQETTIVAKVNLDTNRPININTGIGFYDHMLEQLAKHGGFSLQLHCSGDLDVDEHHTVEDTAICLGKAIRKALGNKRGIARYGFLLPMDESESRVSLDLSGRAFFVFKGKFPREQVGALPTELITHFFHTLSDSLGAALHIKVKGENTHHMIEACFKSVGRALRQAIRIEGSDLPSTKGMLS